MPAPDSELFSFALSFMNIPKACATAVNDSLARRDHQSCDALTPLLCGFPPGSQAWALPFAILVHTPEHNVRRTAAWVTDHPPFLWLTLTGAAIYCGTINKRRVSCRESTAKHHSIRNEGCTHGRDHD